MEKDVDFDEDIVINDDETEQHSLIITVRYKSKKMN